MPRLANQAQERQRVVQQVQGGSLNGILKADQLPVDRQIVGKLLVSHLYALNPIRLDRR